MPPLWIAPRRTIPCLTRTERGGRANCRKTLQSSFNSWRVWLTLLLTFICKRLLDVIDLYFPIITATVKCNVKKINLTISVHFSGQLHRLDGGGGGSLRRRGEEDAGGEDEAAGAGQSVKHLWHNTSKIVFQFNIGCKTLHRYCFLSWSCWINDLSVNRWPWSLTRGTTPSSSGSTGRKRLGQIEQTSTNLRNSSRWRSCAILCIYFSPSTAIMIHRCLCKRQRGTHLRF